MQWSLRMRTALTIWRIWTLSVQETSLQAEGVPLYKEICPSVVCLQARPHNAMAFCMHRYHAGHWRERICWACRPCVRTSDTFSSFSIPLWLWLQTITALIIARMERRRDECAARTHTPNASMEGLEAPYHPLVLAMFQVKKVYLYMYA